MMPASMRTFRLSELSSLIFHPNHLDHCLCHGFDGGLRTIWHVISYRLSMALEEIWIGLVVHTRQGDKSVLITGSEG